jgi:hypothetical protein
LERHFALVDKAPWMLESSSAASAYNLDASTNRRISHLFANWKCRDYHSIPFWPQGAALPLARHDIEPGITLFRHKHQLQIPACSIYMPFIITTWSRYIQHD